MRTLAAAAALDGTLLVAYIPPAHSGPITVDMRAMSGRSQARWFDPTCGVYDDIGTELPNTGPRVFTPPGSNGASEGDWILLIETAAVVPKTPDQLESHGYRESSACRRLVFRQANPHSNGFV